MALIDKETISNEIERRREYDKFQYDHIPVGLAPAHYFKGVVDTWEEVLEYLDTLPEQPVEEIPEPYTGIYDEAYLQEKIAKATKSWEGVDVDKMLAECRGYEQPVTDCHELEEEIENYFGNIPDDTDKIDIARHFAEWGAEHGKK